MESGDKVTLTKTVVYKEAGGVSLSADVYLPAGQKRAPSPVWFYTHGGGWIGGDRGEPKLCERLCDRLLDDGVAIVSVQYRLCTNGVMFPIPVDDCADALRYFAARAGEYHLDLSRAMTGGISAGGHLALMLAFAAERFGETRADSPRLPVIRCVADLCGPTDLEKNGCVRDQKGLLTCYDGLLGGDRSRWAELYTPASPITHLKALPEGAPLPAVMAVHGQMDPLVDKGQPLLVSDEYAHRGGAFELIPVANGNHGFGQVKNCPPPDITFAEIQDRLYRFIRDHL